MNILYVITGLGIGGAEMVTVNIANEMCKRGHQVSIFYLVETNMVSHLIDDNVTVMGGGMKRSLFSMIKRLFEANRYIKSFRPQVVHSHMFHANIFSRILHLFDRSFFLITTEHNKNIEGKIRMLIYRLTDRLADVNTNVSKEATDYFVEQKAFSKNKSFTVYNGIHLNKFKKDVLAGNAIREQYGILKNDFLFLNVGRLTEAKNQECLIHAFSKLSAKYDTVKLMIVGDGHLRRQLEKLISDLNLTERILLVGAQSNISDFYSAADCFVLSSSWEGLPMAIIEAKAASLPVVTTTAGQEIVDKDFVVPVNDPDLLMKKMEMLLLMSIDILRAVGEKNRMEATIFDIEMICDKWENYYKS
ncbi:glycosyltransferase [Bacteroides sp.]